VRETGSKKVNDSLILNFMLINMENDVCRIIEKTAKEVFKDTHTRLNRIAGDVGLMAEVARRLRSLDRWEGRARLPGRLRELARQIEEKARAVRGRS